MNHRAKSVVRHMVEGDKSRARYFFCQPLNGVEFLLQRQTRVPQDMEATEVKRAEKEVLFRPQQDVRSIKYKKERFGGNSHQLSYNVVKNPCIRSRLVLYTGES